AASQHQGRFPWAALQFADLSLYVAGDALSPYPRRVGHRARDHVLLLSVLRTRDLIGVVSDGAPLLSEQVMREAAEHERARGLAHLAVVSAMLLHEPGRPAAMLEPPSPVLASMSRRLDDAVEGNVLGCD